MDKRCASSLSSWQHMVSTLSVAAVALVVLPGCGQVEQRPNNPPLAPLLVPTASPLSAVGGTCEADSDCAGEIAMCLAEGDGFQGGYCLTLGCAENGCAESAACYFIDEEQSQSGCFRACANHDDCRAGYLCHQEYAICWPEPEPLEGNVGAPCVTEHDCTADATTCLPESAGLVGGYCTLADCSSSGCPTGSECFLVSDDAPAMCLANCQDDSDCREGYACLGPGACWVPPPPPCTTESCPKGTFCASNGECVPEVADLPAGPVPACDDVPSWRCSASEQACAELVPFLPIKGNGYWNYPINGESLRNQYRSFLRRDLWLLVKHAAALTACRSEQWSFGNHEPLGLGDMSEINGDIPGSSIGSPGHPQGTHVNGYDIDIAYYQKGTPDNRLRPVCSHVLDDTDQYHCVGPADLIEPWRTALFVAALHVSAQLRVIGVDGKVGPLLTERIMQLCHAGWIATPACKQLRLAYEVTDSGRGWYYFHHHHMHVSTVGPQIRTHKGRRPPSLLAQCLTPDCSIKDAMAEKRLEINATRLSRTAR